MIDVGKDADLWADRLPPPVPPLQYELSTLLSLWLSAHGDGQSGRAARRARGEEFAERSHAWARAYPRDSTGCPAAKDDDPRAEFNGAAHRAAT